MDSAPALPNEQVRVSHSHQIAPAEIRNLPELLSGFGQYHTNEADPDNPDKKLTPYVSIDLDSIRALVDEPQRVDKEQAQWLIPSTLQSRTFAAQEARGEFWLLWADLDKDPKPIDEVEATLCEVIPNSDFEVYASRSAREDHQKARILIPLFKPLCGADWLLFQEVLNDKLDGAGLTPDRVSEGAAQLCYLPNRGEFYDSRSARWGDYFDPLEAWATEIEAKRAAIVDQALALEVQKKAAAERREALKLSCDSPDLIGAFNQAYTVQDILLKAGYAQRGDSFRHPQSESGSYSASVKSGRVFSMSTNDPLYTTGKSGGKGAHDAFSAFCVLYAGGDQKEALKLAGDSWLSIGGESWNKVRQREYAQRLTVGGVTPISAVTDVTDVQASTGADLAVTAAESPNVTGVTPGAVIPAEIERPCFKVFDDLQTLRDSKLRPGVWYFGVKRGKKPDDPPNLTQQWVCSPLHIEAVTFDGQDNNFGRLLRFKTTNGKWREWAMPMELLRGAGDDLRGELLAMGVLIDPHGKDLLSQYLQAITPTRSVHCALQVGWCGDSFVLPDTVIGPNAQSVIFQSGERGHDEHTQAGTLAGWQSEIAAQAVGNPILILAMSASFTGPLLLRCNGESGGIHFVGDSSTGKTTAIDAACATWGGANFRRSWRATANGMEGAAALFNDCLMALDEISECEPKEVGTIVYALGNGRGKQRASRTGNARGVTRWRVTVLSSGERTIATTMAEAGVRTKAGQSVRLLDIPAARKYGAFDNLHGLPNGAAFADAIRRAAITHHGHAGRVFLEKLTRDKQSFIELLERFKALPEFAAEGGEGQEKRVAGRFALFALAGELATDYGITGWPEGAATEAAAECFKAWHSQRGNGNDERHKILEQVSGFIDRHGDSRFSNADTNERDEPMRVNRAGWWRGEGSGRVYLFNADGMREALKGFDFNRALNTLQEAGALPESSGERSKSQRIGGRLTRVYAILADKLGGNHGT